MNTADRDATTLRAIRRLTALFIAGLVLSGLTAFPLQTELDILVAIRGAHAFGAADGTMDAWLLTVRNGLGVTYRDYPWMGYGTDWLAFSHLVIAIFFIGVWREPVRNIWVQKAGLLACAGVIPIALMCGAMRGIPSAWRLIDCCFGIFGAIPLLIIFRLTHRLEHAKTAE